MKAAQTDIAKDSSLRGIPITCFGAGNMGSAIIKGLIDQGAIAEDQVRAVDPSPQARDRFLAQFPTAKAASSLDEGGERWGAEGGVFLLAVKPRYARDALLSIGSVLMDVATSARTVRSEECSSEMVHDPCVVSVVAGLSTAAIEGMLAGVVAPLRPVVIRAMPNTPALVRRGVTALCAGQHAQDKHMRVAVTMFGAVGHTEVLHESMFDAVTGLSGSGPAYLYLAMEAMSDAGVKLGLPRDVSLRLAAHTVQGAAAMVLQTGQSPAALKEQVTSPGGTTITGVASLERNAVRAAFIDAVEAAAEKSRLLQTDAEKA